MRSVFFREPRKRNEAPKLLTCKGPPVRVAPVPENDGRTGMTSPRMTHPLTGIDYPRQCRDWEETPYTKALGDALESLFDLNIHDLDGIVASLNEADVMPPDGGRWTAERFMAEMARLGG